MASGTDRNVHKRKIVVKKISSSCTKFTLENFLEIVFDNDVESVEYYKDIKETALVTFKEDVEDFDKYQQSNKAKKHLEGSHVELVQVAAPDSILIENLQSNVSQDALSFYFENKKSGGKNDAVVNCKIYSSLKVAVVTFVDIQVAASVLGVKSHAPSDGHVVSVTPYIEALHHDTLEKLSLKTEEDIRTLNISKMSSPDQAEKNTKQNILANSVAISHFDKIPSEMLSQTASSNNILPVNGQLAEITDHMDTDEENKMMSSPLQTTSQKSNLPEQTFKSNSIDNQDSPYLPVLVDTWVDKNKTKIVIPETKIPTGCSIETSEVQKSAVPFQIPHLPSQQNGSQWPLQMHEAKNEREKIVDEMERKTEEERHADSRPKMERPTKITTKVLHYKHHEVKLIEMAMTDMGYTTDRVDFDVKKGIITIKGKESEIDEAKLVIMETKNQIEDASLHLSSTVVKILKTDAGRDYLKNGILDKGVEYTLSDRELKCAALSEDKVHNAVQGVKDQIQQEHVKFGQEHGHYLSSEAWAKKKDSLEKEYQLMRITCDDNNIQIDGLNGDVVLAKKDVQRELLKNSHMSKTFSVTKAKARCFEKCYQKEIADLKFIISKCNGVFNESSDGGTYTINFSGEVSAVEQVSASLHTLVKSIWHENVTLVKDVAKDKDLELLITGLSQKDLKVFQVAFEAQHSCFLDIAIPKLSSSLTSSTSAARKTSTFTKSPSLAFFPEHDFRKPSTFTKSPSLAVYPQQGQLEEVTLFDRPVRRVGDEYLFGSEYETKPQPRSAGPSSITVPSTNCKITVTTGDITKQKADILANVVNSNRDLTSTRISQAFSKAGGSAFVTAYDATKVLPGGLISVSAVGNLNCSHVLSIVLDPWDINKQDNSKTKLNKAIDDCFQFADAQNATSIAFPPAGCGILFKFPAKFVAASFMSAATAAAKKGKLQEISFHIFDKAVHYQFVTALNPSLQDTSFHSRGYTKHPDEEEQGPSVIKIGSTSIGVKQGDIVKHKATVLVNVITSEFDPKRTAVSQAFVRAGGGGLLKAIEKETSANPQKKVFVTFGYDLNCEYVYHVVINKYDHSNSAASRQELIDTIDQCFTIAQKYKTKSIAFPAIGCGVLFKYSAPFVATSMVSAAKNAASVSKWLKEVMFVIYDQHIFRDFVKELSSDDKPNVLLSSDNESNVLPSFPRASERNRKPSEEVKTAQITIEAKTKDTCVNAKKALIKHLQSTFLHREYINNNSITKLPYTAFKELQTLAEKKGIFIKFPDSRSTKTHKTSGLKLKGEKETVKDVTVRVHEILLTEMSKTTKQIATRKRQGDPEFIQYMATTSDHLTPKYWTYFKSEKSIADHIKKLFKMSKKKWSLEDVTSGSDIYNAIDDLVVKTWKTNLVGHGNDAVGIPPSSSIKVVKIQRLENLELFRGYCQHRAKLFLKAAKNKIKPIHSLPNSKGEVETTAMASKPVRQEIYVKEINEHYVFHGTKQDRISIICEKGLDSRVGNVSAMFGPGIYAAESSTKADQYADDKSKRQVKGTQLTMILARISLGEPFVTSNKQSPKFRQPPCKHGGCHKDGCTTHTEAFDSVLGDGHWNFREFVVYERDLIYPEYIITYVRK